MELFFYYKLLKKVSFVLLLALNCWIYQIQRHWIPKYVSKPKTALSVTLALNRNHIPLWIYQTIKVFRTCGMIW